MSAKKPTTRAARAPRAATPKAARPWYAPLPRWFASEGEPGLLMRREPQRYVVRDIARCKSTYQAEQLAAALNRGERAQARRLHEIAVRDSALAKLGDVRHALRELIDALTVPPEKLADLDRAVDAARRVLGDEPTFAPGGDAR